MTQEIIELGKKFAECKKESEELTKKLKAANEAWDAVEKELLEVMLDAQVNSIDIEGVGRLTMSRSSYPSVNAAAKPQFFDYLKDSGNGGLLKLDVNPQTLNAFLKKHIEELRTQLISNGLNEMQAISLSQLSGYENAMQKVGLPVDEMDAAIR
jgi:hypothetical protein